MTTRRNALRLGVLAGAGLTGAGMFGTGLIAPGRAGTDPAAAPPSGAGPAAETGKPDPLGPIFEAWKSKHLARDGRVVDALQQAASHSEGQAYGMLIAATLGDRDAFARMDDWTQQNLAIRDDSLLAWRWLPGAGVQDLNNASDGDIFHAWALVRAAQRFGDPALQDRAAAVAADLARLNIVPMPGQGPDGLTVLLPGTEGFRSADGVILNPAYWCPRALDTVGRATGVEALSLCAMDCVAHLAVLARAGLPPDWILATPDGFGPAKDKWVDFGYEALRVPLYLIWSGMGGHPAAIRAVTAWQSTDQGDDTIPVVIDRQTGAIVETSTDPGYRALAALAGCMARQDGTASRPMPAFSAAQPYYPATLHLMALIAEREALNRCMTV